jgi:DNA (cytosine-5)-methyltransferase 1
MPELRYLSVCSGIEAATVAWHPLGWKPVAFSEIDKFPCAVLAHHYPDVPNLGDMTKIHESEVFRGAAIDLLVGGTPCQAFSVAGLRKGLADPRGNLALEFLRLADLKRPRWIVWENVPGVLSSAGGRDFGSFLGALAQLGYGFAYRVLDAQFFGVAQRRRRVFVVGYLGDWRRAAAVLFERECLLGHPAPSRKAGPHAAAVPADGPRADGSGRGKGSELTQALTGSFGTGGPDAAHAQAGWLVPTLDDQAHAGDTMLPEVTHTLRADGFDASEDGTGRGTPLVPVGLPDTAYCITAREGKGPDSDVTTTLVPVPFDTTQLTNPNNRQNPQPGAPCHALASHAHPPAIAYSIQERGREAGRALEWNEDVSYALTAPAAGGRASERQVAFATPEELDGAIAENTPEISDPITANEGRTYTHEGTNNFRLRNVVPAMPAYGVRTANTGSNGWGVAEEAMHTLDLASPHAVGYRFGVRRLTPRECERLQGFRDDYTLIPGWRAKPASQEERDEVAAYLMAAGHPLEQARELATMPDGPRYKALGNSMAVPVMAYIGRRIEEVEAAIAAGEGQ